MVGFGWPLTRTKAVSQQPRPLGRGPRKRTADRSWTLVTTNVTTWTRVRDLLAWFQRQRHKVGVLFVQELMKPADQIQQAKAGLARSGWEEFAVPSNRTGNGGLSAGAAVLVRAKGLSSQIETEDIQRRHPGRFQAVAWSGVLSRGLLVGFVYCYESGDKDAASKNEGLMAMVARECAAARMPFILGGDWQAVPDAL